MPRTRFDVRGTGRRGLGPLLLLLGVWGATGSAIVRPASAQNIAGAMTPYLNATDLHEMDQDGTGTLWIASNGGALRFDVGDRAWTRFPKLSGTGPRGNDLATVCVDPSGRVWTGSATRGVTVYDPLLGGWDRTAPEDWTDPRIRVVRCVGQAIYVGTQNGLTIKPTPSRSDLCAPDLPSCVIPSYVVNDFARMGDTVWVATQGGLGRYDGAAWNEPAALPAGSIGQDSRSLAVFGGVLWEATGGPVRRLVGGQWQTTSLSGVRALRVSADSLYAIQGSSVYRWDAGASDWNDLGLPTGGTEVRDLRRIGGSYYLTTSDGLLIVPVAGGAAERLRPPGPGLTAPVGGLAVDPSGTVWAGTQQGEIGLMSFDGTTWSLIGPADGLTDRWIWNILAFPDDNLWIGHCCCNELPAGCGTDLRASGSLSTVPDVGDVFSFARDPSGRIWAGTDGFGAVVLENTGGDQWVPTLRLTVGSLGSKFASDFVTAVAVTPDGTYFGHYAGGVDYWRHGPSLEGGSWTHYSALTGSLLDDNVHTAAVSGDDVWIGTTRGIHRFRNGALVSACETRVAGDVNDGPRTVRAIVPDRLGNLWVGTDNGLLFLPRGGICDVTGGGFIPYTEDNSALPSSQVLSGALDPADGSVWFGTGGSDRSSSGLVRIDPLTFVGREPPADRYVLYPNPLDLRPVSGARRVTFGLLVAGQSVQPASGGAVSRPEVFDLSGAPVGRFDVDLRDNSWVWNGQNSSGHVAAPGIYLVRAQTPDGPVVLRLGVVW